jgi:hypothetical protein
MADVKLPAIHDVIVDFLGRYGQSCLVRSDLTWRECLYQIQDCKRNIHRFGQLILSEIKSPTIAGMRTQRKKNIEYSDLCC